VGTETSTGDDPTARAIGSVGTELSEHRRTDEEQEIRSAGRINWGLGPVGTTRSGLDLGGQQCVPVGCNRVGHGHCATITGGSGIGVATSGGGTIEVVQGAERLAAGRDKVTVDDRIDDHVANGRSGYRKARGSTRTRSGECGTERC